VDVDSVITGSSGIVGIVGIVGICIGTDGSGSGIEYIPSQDAIAGEYWNGLDIKIKNK
jgi:hypothetical protein